MPGALHGQAEAAHADYLAWTEKPTEQPGAVNLGAVMVWLRDNLPADAILCNGAGNYAAWIHRFFRFRRFGQHVAPTSGSMGYGVPAAVAMKRLYPERPVICFAGDGDFLMNGQEFATAVQYDLPLMVIIADNGIYGTIRMHQEREYPGRIIATELRNPDFAAYARAFGGFGVTVERTADFPAAFKRGAGLRQAGDHPARDRSGGDHAGDDTRQDSRQVAGGEGRVIVRHRGGARDESPNSEFILCYSAGAIPLPRCAMPYRRTENVARRLAARRDAIIAAARQMASEGGMAAVQIAAVAARAGIAAGTVYRYFPAKTDLVAALLTEIAEREIGALRGAADAAPGPLSALSAAIMSFAGAGAARPPARFCGDCRAGRCRDRLPHGWPFANRSRPNSLCASPRPGPAATCQSRTRRWPQRHSLGCLSKG